MTAKASAAASKSPRRSGRVASVVSTLGERIVAGEYAPGEALPIEPELAEALEVGRTALREAIKILSGKGIVDTGPRSGTRVRPRNEWNMLDADIIAWTAVSGDRERFIDDFAEVRRLIEPEAAALAAKRARRREVADLLAAVEEMELAIGDDERSLEADLRFHSLLVQASHNAILASFQTSLSAMLRVDFEIAMTQPEAYAQNIDLHVAVAEAVAEGDAQAARAASLRLIDANVRDVSTVMRGSKNARR